MPAQPPSAVRRAVGNATAAALVVAGAMLASPAAAVDQGTVEGQPRKVVPGTGSLPSNVLVEDEVIVRWAKGVRGRDLDGLHRSTGVVVDGRLPNLGMDVLKLRPGVSVDAVIRSYERDPRVRFAEQGIRRYPQIVPNDTDFGDLWGLRNTGQTVGGVAGTNGADVDATTAWDTSLGGSSIANGVIVAVLDTGTRLAHEDLADKLWANPGEVVDDLDNDGNGYVDDIHGVNLTTGGSPNQANGQCDQTGCPAHGTHVAGTIGAEFDNGLGVAGACPNCRIMSLRSNLSTGEIVEGFSYALEEGATIVNGSFSGPVWSKAERAAIMQAANQGVLFAFAAGNDELDNDMNLENTLTGRISPSYPASYNVPGIIAVASSDNRDRYSTFSNWGRTSVDIAAPGTNVYSTMSGANNAYGFLSGTSMATPHIAGIAGLVRAHRPSLSPLQTVNALMRGVDQPSSLQLQTDGGAVGGDLTASQGRSDANSALTATTENATPDSDGFPTEANGITKSKNGSLAWPADVNDFFRKRLRKGTTYEARLAVPAGKDFDLVVWTKAVKDTWQFTLGCYTGGACPQLRGGSFKGNGKDETVRFKAKYAGVHYFHATSYFSNGNYTMKVIKV
ncbi:MAG: S8 family peptidase [Actinomycetota bacterium]